MLEALSLGELCVCDLAEIVGVSQSGVSHQLRLLRDRGLVAYRRDGQRAVYRLADEHVRVLIASGLEHADEEPVSERGGGCHGALERPLRPARTRGETLPAARGVSRGSTAPTARAASAAAVERVEGVVCVELNYASATLLVDFDPSFAPVTEIADTVMAAGYGITPLDEVAAEAPVRRAPLDRSQPHRRGDDRLRGVHGDRAGAAVGRCAGDRQ